MHKMIVSTFCLVSHAQLLTKMKAENLGVITHSEGTGSRYMFVKVSRYLHTGMGS